MVIGSTRISHNAEVVAERVQEDADVVLLERRRP